MSKSCLLLIEDYPVIQQMYSSVLIDEGFDVTISGNGKDALQKATENHYDAIILDLLLPDMNGLEFLKQFKAHHAPGKTELIVFSDFDDPHFIAKAKELGIKNYWMKVNNTPHELVEKIKATLSNQPKA